MNEKVITMVFPANVTKAWPQVAQVLKPAVDRVGTHDIEDVRRDILSGKSQLWVQWDKSTGTCDAALITEFQTFPKGLFLNVWLYGVSPRAGADEEALEKQVFNYAFANGCTGIKHEGRKGWLERHKHLPVHCENAVYYLILKDLEAT